MIMIPGRIPDPHASDDMTWWEEILYIIGVFSWLIGSIAFLIYLLFFL